MSDTRGNVPEDEGGLQARRETEALQAMAAEARRLTERRDREAAGLRETEAGELAAREAETYRQAAEIERRMEDFRRTKEREAEEARREAQEREKASRLRAQEGEIADAGSRYAQALGQHYDVTDPYHSLARAAMAEYGAFHREQDRLKREIAAETNVEQRQLLELRRDIEAADYMAITSARLASIGRVVSGRNDAEQALRDEGRSEEFTARSRELREQYRDLVEDRLDRTASAVEQPDKDAQDRGQQQTSDRTVTTRSRGRARPAARGQENASQGSDTSRPARGARVVDGVMRDPERERRDQEREGQARTRNDGRSTQAGTVPTNEPDPAKPSAATLDRIRRQRDRYEAAEPKRQQERQSGRSRGGPSR